MPEEQSYELMPPGSHVATCFRICDVGTQPGQYGPKSQIVISWETPDELMADGRPFSISRRYTLSSGRKATLRDHVESWLGRVLTSADFGKFDLAQLLGTTCTIGIKHETKDDGRRIVANLTSVMKRPKGTPERLPCVNEAIVFSLADRPFREHDYEQLPRWLHDLVARSPEFEAATKPAAPISPATRQRMKAILADSPAPKPEPVAEPLDDSIPF